MVWINLIFIIFISLNIYAQGLTKEEQSYFDFLDFNNDNFITNDEIEKSIMILFALVDENDDKKISIEEINLLKEIIESMK